MSQHQFKDDINKPSDFKVIETRPGFQSSQSYLFFVIYLAINLILSRKM